MLKPSSRNKHLQPDTQTGLVPVDNSNQFVVTIEETWVKLRIVMSLEGFLNQSFYILFFLVILPLLTLVFISEILVFHLYIN